MGVIVAIIGELITAGIVGIFTKDAAVVVLGSQYLRGYIVDCALAGIHFCFSGYFCAYGKSYIGFIHNMIAIICLRVPGFVSGLEVPSQIHCSRWDLQPLPDPRFRLLSVWVHLYG